MSCTTVMNLTMLQACLAGTLDATETGSVLARRLTEPGGWRPRLYTWRT
ncbi:hypothetical protein [Streptomyces coeruleofuscus]